MTSMALSTLCDEGKITPDIEDALERMQSVLTCPLCHDVLTLPSTLMACAHTFCQACIDNYSCDNWTCPVPNCGMPLTSGPKGSFRKLNPAMEGAATAYVNIFRSLEHAIPQWWTHAAGDEDDNNDCDDVGGALETRDEEEESGESESGELIDLQAENAQNKESLSIESDDEDDFETAQA